MSWAGVRAGVLVAAVCASGGRAAAQVRVHSKAMDLTLTGQFQTQFNTTSVAGEPESEFLIRRARITAEVAVNDFVSGKVEPEFGNGSPMLKDAYVRLSFSPAVRATIGQFKRPFDLFKLAAATEILVIERRGDIRGLDSCLGVGGLCSFGQLVEGLAYADRDIGFEVGGQDRRGRFTYAAAVTNGAGPNRGDENGTKSYTARVSASPVARLRVAVNVGVHDYVDSTRGDEYATAFGADVELGTYDGGFHLQAGFVTGDTWRALGAAGPRTFVTSQGVTTFKLRVRQNRFVTAVEPVVRVSIGDPSTATADDGGWLFTPGFVVHFVGRNKAAVNLDIWKPDGGGSATSTQVPSWLTVPSGSGW